MTDAPQCLYCGCSLRDSEKKHHACSPCMVEQYDDYEGVPCPRCMGDGYVICHCAGDLCLCENQGDAPCPVCLGEGETRESKP